MLNKLKVSTKISIYFSIYTTIFFFIVLTFINIFTFYSWYTEETTEIQQKTEKMHKYTLDKHSDEAVKRKSTKENLEKKLWIVLKTSIDKDYKLIWLNIYTKWDKYYLIYISDSKFWQFALPYDITLILDEQVKLLQISIIILILIIFISYFTSKFLFIKFALKDIFNISKKLKNIELHELNKLSTPLRKDDDLYVIVQAINDFIVLIDKYTTNLKEFNSNISHEFRTPLMVMQWEIEFSQETWMYKESYNKIESQINLLNELLETFIFISKIDENKIKLTKKDINISITLTDILDKLEKIYKEKNIEIKTDIKENIVIKTDEKLLYIVIKNLIDNSFKYTGSWWKIEITLNNNSLAIKDNWIWISKEALENIFNNFYRENNSDNKWFGIWLNIVKKILTILWFKIEVKSSKWKWSEFRVKF